MLFVYILFYVFKTTIKLKFTFESRNIKWRRVVRSYRSVNSFTPRALGLVPRYNSLKTLYWTRSHLKLTPPSKIFLRFPSGQRPLFVVSTLDALKNFKYTLSAERVRQHVIAVSEFRLSKIISLNRLAFLKSFKVSYSKLYLSYLYKNWKIKNRYTKKYRIARHIVLRKLEGIKVKSKSKKKQTKKERRRTQLKAWQKLTPRQKRRLEFYTPPRRRPLVSRRIRRRRRFYWAFIAKKSPRRRFRRPAYWNNKYYKIIRVHLKKKLRPTLRKYSSERFTDFVNLYSSYKLYLKYIVRRKNPFKRKLYYSQEFIIDSVDFLYSILKKIKQRRTLFYRRLNKKKIWRPILFRKKFFRKLKSSIRHKFFIRNYQNSLKKNFLTKLSPLLRRYGVTPRPFSPKILVPLTRRLSELRSQLLKRRFYIIMRRKRSNLYYTVINHMGGVVYSLSIGRFVSRQLKRRNRKLRLGYSNHNLIVKTISRALRKKKIYKIHTLFKPTYLRPYVMRKVVNNFRLNGIQIMKINYTPSFTHGRVQKTKKARRL